MSPTEPATSYGVLPGRPGGFAACCFFDLRTHLIPKKIPRARTNKDPNAAPTPIPAFAPVLRSVEELLDVAAGAAEVDCTENAETEVLLAAVGEDEGIEVVEVEDRDVEVEEVDELDDVSFDLTTKARLESWLSTNPSPVPICPLGSLIRRTKFGLWDICWSSTLSFWPTVHVYAPGFRASAIRQTISNPVSKEGRKFRGADYQVNAHTARLQQHRRPNGLRVT